MIRVRRRKLPPEVSAQLAAWQRRLGGKSAPPAAEIKRQWGRFNDSPVRRAVERVLVRQTRAKCVYCENIGARTIDHFYPKLLRPATTFSWANFNWACWPCNLNKGDTLPMAGRQPLLVNPMREEAGDYFFIDPVTGYMVPAHGLTPQRTARAVYTIGRMKLNAEDLRRQRRAMAVGVLAALAVFADTGGRLAERALLHALQAGATMRAVVRQLIRSREPETRGVVAACIERSRRVSRYLRALGWMP